MNSFSRIISDETSRLDTFLTQVFPTFSRSYFQYLISEGAVLVNDHIVKKSCKLKPDDEVEVQFILTKEIALEPENIPLNIIYEDEHLLAINKPAGMVVHPGPGNPNQTFVNALLYHCKNLERDDTLRPGIVHRLDKDTSGILIAAKTRACHQALIELFSQRKIEKQYIALCQGIPKISTIDAPIGRHSKDRKLMAVCSSGRAAVTHLQVIKSHNGVSLLRIRLETGRTHQIRVHLKHIGHPLLGDAQYGVEKSGILRPMLHAESLSFVHPFTNKYITIGAPFPSDIEKAIDKYIPLAKMAIIENRMVL